MAASRLVWFILSLLALFSQAVAQNTQRRAAESSDLEDVSTPVFNRRAFHGSWIINNGSNTTLYIDGGEEKYSNMTVRLANEYTLSIDLSTSFSTLASNNTVFPRSIDKKGVPSFISTHMLLDNDTVYAYGGELSWDSFNADNSKVPEYNLFAFTANKDGGIWENRTNNNDSVWKSLIRTDGSSTTYRENIGAWSLGGRANRRTDPRTYTSDNSTVFALPGLQFFNYTDLSWKNYSSASFGLDGTSFYGQLQHVPTWGKYGLVVALGGGPVTTGSELFDMSNVSVWDQNTQNWYYQTANGNTPLDIPPSRSGFCVVGASASTNGTYEIFVYGGLYVNNVGNNGTDYVWVLSLPAFQWFRVAAMTTERRAYHTCHGYGRQLISVGGLDYTVSSSWDDRYDYTDPYTQGLKVFDMTELNWTNYFDATAPPYETPGLVTNYYNSKKDANGNVFPEWDQDGLRDLFIPYSGKKTSTISDGAIAGAVVGSIAGVALTCAIAFFVARAVRKSKLYEMGDDTDFKNGRIRKAAELPSSMTDSVVMSSTKGDSCPTTTCTELTATGDHPVSRAELPVPQTHEMWDHSTLSHEIETGKRSELP